MKAFIQFNGKKGKSITVSPGEMGIWEIEISFDENDEILEIGAEIRFQIDQHRFILGNYKQNESENKQDYVWIDYNGVFTLELKVSSFWINLSVIEGKVIPGNKIMIYIGKSLKRELLHTLPEYIGPPAHYFIQIKKSAKDSFKNSETLTLITKAGHPSMLEAVIPSIIKTNTSFDIRMKWLDLKFAPKASYVGKVKFKIQQIPIFCNEYPLNGYPAPIWDGLDYKNKSVKTILEDEFEFIKEDNGIKILKGITISESGIFIVKFLVKSDLLDRFEGWSEDLINAPDENYTSFSSNTFIILDEPPFSIYWGDLHTHTKYKDGMGSWKQCYDYAKYISFLDVFSESCHILVETKGDLDKPYVRPNATLINWNMDWYWKEKQSYVKKYYDPDTLVTILGFEWSPIEPNFTPGVGDHNIYFKNDEAPLLFRNNIQDLIEDIKKYQSAFIIPHVGGWEPNLYYEKWDRKIIPLIEISSVHGHFEHFLQEGLMRGYKFGVCAMSDGHQTNPGNYHLTRAGRLKINPRSYSRGSGLTAIMAKKLEREAIYNSMVQGNTYASSGLRPIVWFQINKTNMAQTLEFSKEIVVLACCACNIPLDSVELICDEFILKSIHFNPNESIRAVKLSWSLKEVEIPTNINLKCLSFYLRITSRDGNISWSSPIWMNEEKTDRTCFNNNYKKWYESIWPKLNQQVVVPLEKVEIGKVRFKNMLERWNLVSRFVELNIYGVFVDSYGKYIQYRGFDTLARFPCRLNYYLNYENDVLYAAHGNNDAGIYDMKYKLQKWLARSLFFEDHLKPKRIKIIPFLRNSVPPVDKKFQKYWRPEIYLKRGDNSTFWDEMQLIPTKEDIIDELNEFDENDIGVVFGMENIEGDWFLARKEQVGWKMEFNEKIIHGDLNMIKEIMNKLLDGAF
jgi:hypothetical protein